MVGNAAQACFSKGGPPSHIKKLDFPTSQLITDVVKDELEVKKLWLALKKREIQISSKSMARFNAKNEGYEGFGGVETIGREEHLGLIQIHFQT